MADLATELANLNAKATELLAKYNGAFEKLDEETQNKITLLQDKAAELQTQIESLGFKFDENGILIKEDGSEISVGNALKLGGKDITYFLTRELDFDSGWISQYDSNVKKIPIQFNTCLIKVFAKVANPNCSNIKHTDYVEVPPAIAIFDNFRTRGSELCWTFTSNEVQVWGNTSGGDGGDIIDGCVGIDIRVLAWKGVSL